MLVRGGISVHVCLGGLCYIFYITLYFKAEKTDQKCFEREAKQKSGGLEKS